MFRSRKRLGYVTLLGAVALLATACARFADRPAGTDGDLLAAATAGDTSAVQAALAADAELEARDGQGRTALMLAVNGNHLEVAQALVEAGADPDARDDRGDTPWLETGVTGSPELMRAVLAAGPDLATRNRFGGSPLHPAAERGHADFVAAILEETAIDVDRVNRLGWTALHEAVILGDGGEDHQRIVRLLLDHGADAAVPDSGGRTALDHARDNGDTAIAAILEQFQQP
ncbi:ankyrin repeat domain-containing protein [Glycomyces paridis]|uniref:Ankyrin repeat domain-containing protein n=1 Tax=Glycomyces paridis TaxID=2126555 RepID=A0A4S8P0G5_9ACTN|nr:ankyrin repeat domain-containing protein [Glycomyces paridis]THV23448.1 ankyrin repeat domain-containing protein [Glycomyces paridis]